MLHSDLLDSPSHVNIQERREGERVRRMGNNLERGSDREKVFSMAVVKERERERQRVMQAVIMVEENEETGSAGQKTDSCG